jgi:hypothetical protein
MRKPNTDKLINIGTLFLRPSAIISMEVLRDPQKGSVGVIGVQGVGAFTIPEMQMRGLAATLISLELLDQEEWIRAVTAAWGYRGAAAG